MAGIKGIVVGFTVAFVWVANVQAEDHHVKKFLRAVSDGTLKLGSNEDLGALSPYVSAAYKPISHFENADFYISIGRNENHEIVLYAWMKSNKHLSLNEATSIWVEETLAAAETLEAMAQFKEFRRLVRGAIYDVKDSRLHLEAAAFVEDYLYVGKTTELAELQATPVAFRFSYPEGTLHLASSRQVSIAALKTH